jgi:serine/threonine-protein kinase
LTGIGGPHVLISPDGTRLVYRIRGADGKVRLATRSLDRLQATPLAGTENAANPFFSPDGQWVGFFADRKLKKIPVQGGVTVTLCDAPAPRGASWGEDGGIIAALSSTGGLSLVTSEGGSPQPITQLNREKQELTHRFPQHLPKGKGLLFVSSASNGNYNEATIEAQSLQTGQRKTLQRGAYFGHYLPSGHLIYMRQGVLFAAPFDLDRLELSGAPVPVLEDVPTGDLSGTAQFDFSQTGTVVYRSGKEALGENSIFWLESSGKTQRIGANPAGYTSPRFSPDGSRLALAVTQGGKSDVWIYDLDRETMTRLTSQPGDHMAPVWTPDGKRVAFLSVGQGIAWMRADGGGEVQRLTESSRMQVPASFSPDGKRLAFMDFLPGTTGGIFTLPIEFADQEHPKPGKPEPFLQTTHTELNPAFSPDGRWLAYSSTDSGTMEIYVRPFPGPGGKWQISNGGGSNPVWSPKAHELFYTTRDSRIMVAPYSAKGDSFAADKPRLWSTTRILDAPPASSFDIAPDGKRFAILAPAEGAGEQKLPTQMIFLFNYFDELRRRVPVR